MDVGSMEIDPTLPLQSTRVVTILLGFVCAIFRFLCSVFWTNVMGIGARAISPTMPFQSTRVKSRLYWGLFCAIFRFLYSVSWIVVMGVGARAIDPTLQSGRRKICFAPPTFLVII